MGAEGGRGAAGADESCLQPSPSCGPRFPARGWNPGSRAAHSPSTSSPHPPRGLPPPRPHFKLPGQRQRETDRQSDLPLLPPPHFILLAGICSVYCTSSFQGILACTHQGPNWCTHSAEACSSFDVPLSLPFPSTCSILPPLLICHVTDLIFLLLHLWRTQRRCRS